MDGSSEVREDIAAGISAEKVFDRLLPFGFISMAVKIRVEKER